MTYTYNQSKLETRFDQESLAWQNRYRTAPANKFTYIDKQYRRKYVFDLFGSGPGLALDLGCGPGGFFHSLCDSGFTVIGLDYSQEMLKLADEESKKNAGIQLVRGNALELPFKPNTFDAIIAAGLPEYFPDDLQFTNELKRIIKPKGKIILTLRNSRCVERNLWKFYRAFFNIQLEAAGDYREHNPGKLKAFILSQGFTHYRQRFSHFYPFPWPISEWLKPINNYLAHIMERLFSKGPLDILGSVFIASFEAPEQLKQK